MNADRAESDSGDDRVLKLESGDLLAFDQYRGEVRVFKGQPRLVSAAMTLPHAQKAAFRAASEARELREALCNLWRAITDDDLSDHAEARIEDAIAEARRLAPYEPEEVSEDGF